MLLKGKKTSISIIIFIFILFVIPNLIYKSNAATAITTSGGALTSGEYYLTANTSLTQNISIASGNTVVIDLSGYVLQGTGANYCISNAGTLTIKDSVTTTPHKGNLNSNGSWVWTDSSGTTSIYGGIICNKATGVTIFNSGKLYITGGTISGSSGSLGAVTNSSNGYLEMTGGKVMYNYSSSADYGGAGIYGNASVNGNSGATLIISNAEISYNKCAGNGAGIYAGATLEISNSKISNNTAAKSGGAIFTEYGAKITGGTEISYNTASYAGGIYNLQDELIIDNSVVKENLASSTSGGGIFIEKGASLELTNSEVSDNVSQVYGGGIFGYGNMNITSSAIIYNDSIKDASTATSSGRGGGICVSSSDAAYPAHVELTDVTIEHNRAMYYGGGMQVMGAYASATLNSGSISYNETIIEGAGAVHVTSSGTFTMINGSKMEYNYGRSVGGAIHSSYGCTINLQGGTISNNTVVGRGGAVNVNVGGILNLQGTNIQNNKAIAGNNYTYAKYENREITFIDEEVEIVNGCGGGVVIDSGALTMSSGIVSDNYATDYGGGIALIMFSKDSGGSLDGNEVVTFTITDGIIENNTTDGDGGGIYLMENSFKYLTDENVPDELKNGIPTFTATGGTIRNNVAQGNGGAAYLDTDTKFIIDGTANICDNEAKKNGGAIYISKGTAEINNGTMNNNIANENGGAVFVNGTITVNNGVIRNCQAVNGAGIYMSNGDMTMNGGYIQNNQASEYGGGIYTSSDSQDLKVNITSGSIIGNIANKHGGGIGINISDGYAANITVGLESCKGLNDAHSHPIIQDNTANENGGGFWINGDNVTMNMYCGSIEKNLALLEPGSANIYQTGGLATVYAGTVGEGVIVIGGKYDYVPDNDIPEVYITYNSNIPENVETKTAEVTVGVEIYLPKTLFSRDGYILLGWSYSENPTTEDTIFEAGKPYLVTDQDVTVYAVWEVIGVGEIEIPVVKAGKHYDEITGTTNILVSNDAEVTIQMVVNEIEVDLYKNRTLSFDKNLENGTTIVMINMTNLNEREFYYYKITNNETNKILLTDFKNMINEENTLTSVSNELENEAYLFIIDLPNNTDNIGPTQVTLTRYADKDGVADIEQKVSYTTTEKRSFSLNRNNEEITINDNLNIIYEKSDPIGEDTRFANKNMALILSAADGEVLLEETMLYDGTTYYKINADGKFVIPLNGVTENFELNLKIISNVLSENEQGCNLKAELWVSANENSENPFMGDKVAEIESISLEAIELPAVRGEMSKRIYSTSEFDGKLKLKYNTKKVDNCKLSLEVQKKNENGIYETLSDILKSVDSVETNTNGVFELTLSSSGTINLEINDSQNAEIGTYRILMKVIQNNEAILEVPYNFIILE